MMVQVVAIALTLLLGVVVESATDVCLDVPIIGSFRCPKGGSFKMQSDWSWSLFGCDIKKTESIYTRIEQKCDLGSCHNYTDPDRWYREAHMDCSIPSFDKIESYRSMVVSWINDLDIGDFEGIAGWALDLLQDGVIKLIDALLGSQGEDWYNSNLQDQGSYVDFFNDICVIHDICYRGTSRSEIECDDDLIVNLIHFCSYTETTNQKLYKVPHGDSLLECYQYALVVGGFVRAVKTADAKKVYYERCAPQDAHTSTAAAAFEWTQQSALSETERSLRNKILGMKLSSIMGRELERYNHVATPYEAGIEWKVNAMMVVTVCVLLMLCVVQCRVFGWRRYTAYTPVKMVSDLGTDTEC